MRKEERTIRRDLHGPLTRFRVGQDVAVPYFRRKLKQPTDTTELANVLDVAVNQLGMRVPSAWAHDALGIPQSDNEEATVAGVAS